MKKLVIILTALCMLLALGCGGEKKAAPAQTKEKTKEVNMKNHKKILLLLIYK